jgi:Spy/CpxP family protein refolding chaperone
MNLRPYIVAVTLVVAAASVWAQPPAPDTPPTPPPSTGVPPTPRAAARPATPTLPGPPAQVSGDILDENFFPPELIMQHQKALGLTADQQATIRAEMSKMMARFTDLQWQQSAETETMASLVIQERPDEKEVLGQLDKLLSIETLMKRLRVEVLVRIKNTLTPEQQAQLRQLTGRGTLRRIPFRHADAPGPQAPVGPQR